MKVPVIFAIAVAAAACSSPAPAPAETEAQPLLTKYHGLIGQWIDSSGQGYVVYERWAMHGDSLLEGIGHVVANGDTVFLEELRIAGADDRITYAVRSGSQNNGEWVHFVAENTGPDTLMFENATHDFPQCITYVKHADGWAATVTGNERGKERVLNYRFLPRP